MLGARQILVGPFFPVKEFLSQIIIIWSKFILDLRVISDEVILAGKLQLKKLQKMKPEKNSGFDGAWTRASQILVGRSLSFHTFPPHTVMFNLVNVS